MLRRILGRLDRLVRKCQVWALGAGGQDGPPSRAVGERPPPRIQGKARPPANALERLLPLRAAKSACSLVSARKQRAPLCPQAPPRPSPPRAGPRTPRASHRLLAARARGSTAPPRLRREGPGKAAPPFLPHGPSQRGPFPAGALRTMEPGQAPLLREPAAGPAPFPADGAEDESKGLKRPNRPASEEAAGPARVRWRLPIGAEAAGGRTQPRPALPSAPPPRPLLDHEPPGGETAGSASRAGWVGGLPGFTPLTSRAPGMKEELAASVRDALLFGPDSL